MFPVVKHCCVSSLSPKVDESKPYTQAPVLAGLSLGVLCKNPRCASCEEDYQLSNTRPRTGLPAEHILHTLIMTAKPSSMMGKCMQLGSKPCANIRTTCCLWLNGTSELFPR